MAWLPVRAVVLLSVPLRKSIVAKCSQYGVSTIILLPVSVGHSGQEPLCLREACANLARTLRKIQDVWNRQGSKLHATVASMAYYHSKSMTSIQSLVCLNWLYLCKPEGRHTKQTMQQGSNGTRHQSRLVPLCCVTLFVVYSFISVSIIYVISGLREACAYMSLREACEKLTRTWRHSFFKTINSTEY